MAICPIICSFYYLARALKHDVACEFACAVGCAETRELTNRRLLHDGAVRLRDILTAHAFVSTCQLRAKVDDVGESDLPASWKQEDVMLVFKVFSRCFGYFAR